MAHSINHSKAHLAEVASKLTNEDILKILIKKGFGKKADLNEVNTENFLGYKQKSVSTIGGILQEMELVQEARKSLTNDNDPCEDEVGR